MLEALEAVERNGRVVRALYGCRPQRQDERGKTQHTRTCSAFGSRPAFALPSYESLESSHHARAPASSFDHNVKSNHAFERQYRRYTTKNKSHLATVRKRHPVRHSVSRVLGVRPDNIKTAVRRKTNLHRPELERDIRIQLVNRTGETHEKIYPAMNAATGSFYCPFERAALQGSIPQ